MSEHHKNRLHSFWPKPSASGAAAPVDPNLLAAKLEPIVENVGAAIAEHPRTSLTVAATLGAVIGWFIKRN